MIIRLILSMLTVAGMTGARAISNHSAGIGAVANNLMAPVMFGNNFIGSIAVALGLSFLLAAMVKYMRHRQNPLAYPISTVIVLIAMGIFLLVLPYAHRVTLAGMPMTFPYGH